MKKWLIYDILTVIKNTFYFVLFLSVPVGFFMSLREKTPGTDYLFICCVLWVVLYPFIILPRIRSKILWRGSGKYNDYCLVRSIGKFQLIKNNVTLYNQIIEDRNKDGVADVKFEIHYVGRLGCHEYHIQLEEIDIQAFHEAMRFT